MISRDADRTTVSPAQPVRVRIEKGKTRRSAESFERNFWRLLASAKIPRQTYNYVFYIVSAAVIGENPRLFGFDFENPLQ